MAEIPKNSFEGPLAPKFGLNDNYRSPLGSSDLPDKPRRNLSGFVPVGILILAILIIPITVQQLGKQQDLRQNAAEPTPTLALPTPVVQTPTPTAPEASPSAKVQESKS